MAPGARSMFGAPMSVPKVFPKSTLLKNVRVASLRLLGAQEIAPTFLQVLNAKCLRPARIVKVHDLLGQHATKIV